MAEVLQIVLIAEIICHGAAPAKCGVVLVATNTELVNVVKILRVSLVVEPSAEVRFFDTQH
jgi:hypothetical protein